jgi:hypothetical protein
LRRVSRAPVMAEATARALRALVTAEAMAAVRVAGVQAARAQARAEDWAARPGLAVLGADWLGAALADLALRPV